MSSRTLDAMKIIAATLIGAAALALTFSPAASTAAPWRAPQKVSTGESARVPVVADLPDGGVTMAWTRSGGVVRVADREPGQPFETSTVITGEGVPEFVGASAIDVSPNGTTALLMRTRDDAGDWLKVAIRPPGGSFGQLETVAQLQESNSDEQIEIDDDGNVVVAWEKTTSVIVNGFPQTTDIEILAAVKPAGGDFGTRELLSTPEKWTFGLDLEGDADGDVTAIWPESTGSGVLVNTRTIEPGGTFSAADTIDFGNRWSFPEIRYRADGSSTIFVLGGTGLNFSDRPAGGSWGAVQSVPTGMDGYGFDVEVGPDGSDTATWAASDGQDSRIVATNRPAGGSFATPAVISGGDDDAHRPWVATGPDSGSAVVWFERNGPEDLLRGAVSDGASFGADRTLTELDSELGIFDYGITGGGAIKTVWKVGTRDGRSSLIEATDFGPGPVQPFEPVAGNGETTSSLSVSFADSTAQLTWQQGVGALSMAQSSIRGPWDPDIYSGDWEEGLATDPDSDSQGFRNGRTARVWKTTQGDEVRIRGAVDSRDTSVPVEFTLSEMAGYPSDPVVSFGNGGATAAWEIDPAGPGDPEIQIADFDSEGPLAPVTVSIPGEQTGQPAVADGDLTPATAVAWPGGSGGGEIRVATRGADGESWEKQTVSLPGTVNSDPQVAVRDDGGVVLAWVEDSPAGIIRVAVKEPGDAFGEPIGIVQEEGTASGPSLSVDGKRFTVAWRHVGQPSGAQSIMTATGVETPGPPSSLHGPPFVASAPSVSANDGVRSILWRGAGGRILATSTLGTAPFPAPMSVALGASTAEIPEVAVGSTGQTQAAWIGADGSVYGSTRARPAAPNCIARRMFSLKRVVQRHRGRPAKALFRTRADGRIALRSASLRRPISFRVNSYRTVALPLKLNKQARRKLNRRGSLRIEAKVRFAPAGCRAVVRNLAFRLRR